ncbi:MAG: xanthine dehydrogenase family protein subunit M [Alphaproteobacteria bacterium]|nr:xanthine dehydrogenase family protein subunit M [Alphaproteobacteria bacterium]
MYAFNYHRPSSVAEAVKLLKSSPDGRCLAGGMSLIPTMKHRLASAADLVDLNGIKELAYIKRDGDALVFGALARHVEIADSADVKKSIPALAALAASVGDPQVRNRGTFCGSLCFADPAADCPAGLVGLNGTVLTDKRRIAADKFFNGLYETTLEKGEIVIGISFPIPEKAGWAKFANLASRFAIAAVMVAKTGGEVRVAVTGAKASVFRVPEMEAALAKNFSAAALDGIKVSSTDMNNDLHGDPDYRAHLVGVMAKRAVQTAMG